MGDSESNSAGAAPEGTLAPETPRRSRLGVLRYPDFARVWAAASLSSIGTWMESVGVQWIVAETTGSTVIMGYVAIAQLGPTLVLGLFGGLAADRYNRRTLLIVTQFVMMIVAALLTVAAWTGHATPLVLIVLMLFHGIAQAFNVPAWQVLTPRLVPREELSHAIALNSLQFNVARIVGPALAGVLLARFGAGPLFLINTLSFLGVILAVSATPDAPVPVDLSKSPWARMREALVFVFLRRGPRRVFVSLVLASVLAGPLLRMLPLFVSEVYHLTESVYGMLLSLMGVGAVVGAASLKFVPRWYPRHHLIPLSLTGLGFSTAAFAASPSAALGAPSILVMGFFWVWSFNAGITAMQLLVDDAMRGRALSVTNTAVFGAMPIGSLAASLLGESAAAWITPDIASRSGVAAQIGVGALGMLLGLAGMITLTFREPEIDPPSPGEPSIPRRAGLGRGITASAHRPARRDLAREMAGR